MWARNTVYHTVLKGNLCLCNCSKVTEEAAHDSVSTWGWELGGDYRKMGHSKMKSRMHMTFVLAAGAVCLPRFKQDWKELNEQLSIK